MVISYDFDECLWGGPAWVFECFLADLGAGHDVWICTARYEGVEAHDVEVWLSELELLNVVPVIYTGRKLKGPYLVGFFAERHYDDGFHHCLSAAACGVEAFYVDGTKHGPRLVEA